VACENGETYLILWNAVLLQVKYQTCKVTRISDILRKRSNLIVREFYETKPQTFLLSNQLNVSFRTVDIATESLLLHCLIQI
jgi:hypothetical protein